MTTTCQEILTLEVSDRRAQRVLAFLRLYMENPNVSAIARSLGVDRKNIYLYVMPKAFALVADELQSTNS